MIVKCPDYKPIYGQDRIRVYIMDCRNCKRLRFVPPNNVECDKEEVE